MTRRFGLTFDYRCPYARIAHEHVLVGLQAGADWEVTYLPFSLGQAHVAEGEPPVWERPEVDTGLLALQASIAVRDNHRDHFEAVHHGLFEHRHGAAGQLKEWSELAPVLTAAGVDADAVRAEIDSGRPLATVEKEHTAYVDSHNVWGVPTFIVDDQRRVRPLAAHARWRCAGLDRRHRAGAAAGRLAAAQRVQAHVDPPLTPLLRRSSGSRRASSRDRGWPTCDTARAGRRRARPPTAQDLRRRTAMAGPPGR